MGRKVTAGTFQFIEAEVGLMKSNKWRDVKTVQQLLTSAGFSCGKDSTGKWSNGSKDAFSKYLGQKRKGFSFGDWRWKFFN